ncbi:unnamed protein product, partial [Mesorhabditis belari]|uniref:Uncharacterized protein n=1 Tax=Mesorhabditis belari TaxID=2138241 RepID=A0AAF3FBQ2_9BILA
MPAILDIEEKFRCKSYRHGAFLCLGLARVAMQDCHHRICFACLAQRVQYANQQNEVPNCAHSQCANRLTRSKMMRIAEKYPNMGNECK